jgi:hypothetical protein
MFATWPAHPIFYLIRVYMPPWKDICNRFLGNVGTYLQNYTTLHTRGEETWDKCDFQGYTHNRGHKSHLLRALVVNYIRTPSGWLIVVPTMLTRWCLTTGRGASNSREMVGRSAADKACRLGREPMLVTSQLLKSPVGDQLFDSYSSASTCNITRPAHISQRKWDNLRSSGSHGCDVKITVPWGVVSCSLLDSYQHFGGTCRLAWQLNIETF